MQIPSGPSITSDANPIHSLHKLAAESCWVSTQSSTEIDQMNLGIKLGEYTISQLSERFYGKVMKDKDEWFRGMFKSNFETLCQNQYDFLIQRLGGPSYYSDRKGNLKLLCKHAGFDLSKRAADRWLKYMYVTGNEAIDDMITDEELQPEYGNVLTNYFKHTAYFLMKANERTDVLSRAGTYDEGSEDLYHCERPTPPDTEVDLTDHDALLKSLLGTIDTHAVAAADNNNDSTSVTSGTSKESKTSKNGGNKDSTDSTAGTKSGGSTGKKGKKKNKKNISSS